MRFHFSQNRLDYFVNNLKKGNTKRKEPGFYIKE